MTPQEAELRGLARLRAARGPAACVVAPCRRCTRLVNILRDLGFCAACERALFAAAALLPEGWEVHDGLGDRVSLVIPRHAGRALVRRAREKGITIATPRWAGFGRLSYEVSPGDVARLLPDSVGAARVRVRAELED